MVTTPNVDNLPARVKFLLWGKIRALDDRGERTHITPVFWDLLTRQWLPRAGLHLIAHHTSPPNGFKCTRPRYAWAFKLLGTALGGKSLLGDTHVFVLNATNE